MGGDHAVAVTGSSASRHRICAIRITEEYVWGRRNTNRVKVVVPNGAGRTAKGSTADGKGDGKNLSEKVEVPT